MSDSFPIRQRKSITPAHLLTSIIVGPNSIPDAVAMLTSMVMCDNICRLAIEQILIEPDNLVRAACIAKAVNLWDDSVFEFRRAVMVLPGCKVYPNSVRKRLDRGELFLTQIDNDTVSKIIPDDALDLSRSYQHSMIGVDVQALCWSIMKTPNNRQLAVAWAKSAGWWDDSVADPCQVIASAPYRSNNAIAIAKIFGWLSDELFDGAINASLSGPSVTSAPIGDSALSVMWLKNEGLWMDEVCSPCHTILQASGNRAMAIALSKTAGWWDDSEAEPCQAILDAPGDRASAIAAAKHGGWWKDPHSLSATNPGLDDGSTNSTEGPTSIKDACEQLAQATVVDSDGKMFKMKVMTSATSPAMTIFDDYIEPYQIPSVGVSVLQQGLVVKDVVYLYKPEFSILVVV